MGRQNPFCRPQFWFVRRNRRSRNFPAHAGEFSELLKGFLKKVSTYGLQVVTEQIAQPKALFRLQIFFAFELQSARLLQHGHAALGLYAARVPRSDFSGLPAICPRLRDAFAHAAVSNRGDIPIHPYSARSVATGSIRTARNAAGTAARNAAARMVSDGSTSSSRPSPSPGKATPRHIESIQIRARGPRPLRLQPSKTLRSSQAAAMPQPAHRLPAGFRFRAAAEAPSSRARRTIRPRQQQRDAAEKHRNVASNLSRTVCARLTLHVCEYY